MGYPTRTAGRDYQLEAASRFRGDGDVPEWSADEAREVAAGILGRPLDGDDCGMCPGVHLHTKGAGVRDFRLFTEGKVPAGYCFHSSCAETVLGFNKELWRRLFTGRKRSLPDGMKRLIKRNSPLETFDKTIRKYDEEALRKVQRGDVVVTGEWLRERSSVDPVGMTTTDFLEGLYREDERVLVFTNEHSQGDYGFQPGMGWSKLGQRKGDANVRVEKGPDGGRCGVWFLSQPVSGKWHFSVKAKNPWSRRREDCVMEGRWRFMLIESDDAPADLWLNALVQLALPIVALYSSGGRSIHALVEVNQKSKQWWDVLRDVWRPTLTTLGACAGSLSAVRLTRLPGCLRHGKMIETDEVSHQVHGRDVMKREYLRYPRPHLQKLIYFNPEAPEKALIDLPRLRVVGKTRGEN